MAHVLIDVLLDVSLWERKLTTWTTASIMSSEK